MAIIKVELQIEGDAGDAMVVVDKVLDSGLLQRAIEGHRARVGRLKVLAAVAEWGARDVKRIKR